MMPSEILRTGSDNAETDRSDAVSPDTERSLRAIGFEPEVAVVRWPAQQSELADLASRGVPRLLLVEPGSVTPTCTSCLEDWVRLPADESELRARLFSLSERHRGHVRPTIDEFGILRRSGAFAIVSQGEQDLARLLIAGFGSVVRDEALERNVVGEGQPSRSGLRTQASRLRKRLAPLGLTVSCIRGVGYMMHEDTSAAESAPPIAGG